MREQYATHYYRGDRLPLLSLSDIEKGELEAVVASLDEVC